MQLEGKNAIITGGSIGLGRAIAEEFVKEGANILICARNQGEVENTKRELELLKVKQNQTVHASVCDVSNGENVKNLFSKSDQMLGELNIVVNNAGIYGPKGPSEDVDIAQWISVIEVNLTGTFLTCREAIRRFKKRKTGKIINLSGGGATAPLPNLSAYAVSKAAVVRLTETLAEEVKEFGIDINSIAPGALNTRLLNEVLEAGPGKVGKVFYEKAIQQQKSGGAGLKKGAELAVFLASAKSDGITGKLIAAVWDGWRNFDQHLDDIKNTDIFTLRRIVTKERGMNWE
jgi:NAD(P)-dependent dehydrogenase (short-subunit alcohol dehydrogenase family)